MPDGDAGKNLRKKLNPSPIDIGNDEYFSDLKPTHCTTNTKINEAIPANSAPVLTLANSSCSNAGSPVMRIRNRWIITHNSVSGA